MFENVKDCRGEIYDLKGWIMKIIEIDNED